MPVMGKFISCVIALLCIANFTWAESPATQPTSAPTYTRQKDLVYGRSYGTALTFDVFRPTGKPNGAAVIFAVSGGWVSTPELLDSPVFALFVNPLTSRGYTVFRGLPRMPAQISDSRKSSGGNINRAVRFIRMHASDYGVDPQRIGIMGASAGGHLSLMQAFAPQPEECRIQRSARQGVIPHPGRRVLFPANRFSELWQGR